MAFVVEASLDREQWQAMGSGAGAKAFHALTNPAAGVNARFIRIRFSAAPGGESAGLDEFRVLAVPANNSQ